ncbi:hypothetical protein [Belnapia sp. F-4-1]|uniref:hypothetical protein n=1 Tax=Belnapia sp. F-4-1 TaxID=1545443 RepID=UPI001F256B5B|nr:hypothetical protein [Belnapia sp. F-4-1]
MSFWSTVPSYWLIIQKADEDLAVEAAVAVWPGLPSSVVVKNRGQPVLLGRSTAAASGRPVAAGDIGALTCQPGSGTQPDTAVGLWHGERRHGNRKDPASPYP